MRAAVDFSLPARLAPGTERIQFRYTAIHLSAPERVQYLRKLEGFDTDWVRAGIRRVMNYNSLRHGKYRFLVRAELPGGPATENAYDFEVLPEFYETAWFRAAVRSRGVGHCLGDLSIAAAADPLPLFAGAGGARAAGARDSRHAGAGLRGHLFAARGGGHDDAR